MKKDYVSGIFFFAQTFRDESFAVSQYNLWTGFQLSMKPQNITQEVIQKYSKTSIIQAFD